MKKISLNGSWNGKCLAKEGEESFSFAGTVPGCVHTDLMGSRIDRNLYFRDNADACQWIESRDWEYSRSFVLEEPCADARLVFEGLDVYCKVFLNGRFYDRATAYQENPMHLWLGLGRPVCYLRYLSGCLS